MIEYQFATEMQQDLAEGAKTILEKDLKPRIHEFECADEGRGAYPMDVHRKLVDAGYYGMGIPEEWGGLGFDSMTQAMIYEEMARVEAGFTFSFMSAGSHFNDILMTKMPVSEKKKWAEMVLAGEGIGAFALTESNAGSDAGAMKMTAKKNGHEWILNGSKCFCTNGSFANYYLVAAYTNKDAGAANGVTFFFVEKDRGVQVNKKEEKLGMKLSETAEIVFDQVSIPDDHVIGTEGKGFTESIAHIGRVGRPYNIACAVGIAQSALDYAVDYAKTRRQFGKRIIDHQGVGFLLAEMKARTDASRALLYYTIEALQKNMPAYEQLSYSMKLICARNALQTASDAIQVFGGYGYMKEYPVEKLFRDARIFPIFGGTAEIQKKNAMKAIAGKDPLKIRA